MSVFCGCSQWVSVVREQRSKRADASHFCFKKESPGKILAHGAKEDLVAGLI